MVLAIMLTSCTSVKEIVDAGKRVTEVQIPIGKEIVVTKDGARIGRVNVRPTKFRPAINEEVYPTYYGVTLTFKF